MFPRFAFHFVLIKGEETKKNMGARMISSLLISFLNPDFKDLISGGNNNTVLHFLGM